MTTVGTPWSRAMNPPSHAAVHPPIDDAPPASATASCTVVTSSCSRSVRKPGMDMVISTSREIPSPVIPARSTAARSSATMRSGSSPGMSLRSNHT